ncbi:MAG: NAD(P)/FAD-dependent oxidoreductase [Anaerolineae bacterium]|nr:NAD(P)/FAD-dependent oxidoreductase [Anaerolineae bacterium]
MTDYHYDIAVVGGGPAGLQATLILARLSKRIIVFDSPESPRNGASHGVHNFIGLDGLTPTEIREAVWRQIEVYNSAELRHERVVNIQHHDDSGFIVTAEKDSSITAKYVILALGFRDIYPDVPGFLECWGDTIIGCPYCDGYENRDRIWGMVASSQPALEHMPHLYRNWTNKAKLIVAPGLQLNDEQRRDLAAQGIAIHEGEIATVQHTAGKVEAVTLNTGEQVTVDTLWWRPDETSQLLTEKVITNFKLELNDNGSIKTDAQYETSIKGLWAVGDVLRGWAWALGAASQGSMAAFAISRIWYADHNSD